MLLDKNRINVGDSVEVMFYNGSIFNEVVVLELPSSKNDNTWILSYHNRIMYVKVYNYIIKVN